MNTETFKNLPKEERKLIFLYVVDNFHMNDGDDYDTLEDYCEKVDNSSIEQLIDSIEDEEEKEEFLDDASFIDKDYYENEMSDVGKEIFHELENEMINSNKFGVEKPLKDQDQEQEKVENDSDESEEKKDGHVDHISHNSSKNDEKN